MDSKQFNNIDCKPSKSAQAARLILVNGFTYRKAAETVGVSIQAVQRWKKTHIKEEQI